MLYSNGRVKEILYIRCFTKVMLSTWKHVASWFFPKE